MSSNPKLLLVRVHEIRYMFYFMYSDQQQVVRIVTLKFKIIAKTLENCMLKMIIYRCKNKRKFLEAKLNMNEKFKSGFVAIIGNPSVGKSTLINSIIGEKIAITSNKPQTTRNAIKGILTNEDYQIIFLDTPGVNKTHTKLAKAMDKSINEAISGTDVVIAMVDLTRRSNTDLFLGKLNKVKCPVILLLNKVDAIRDKQDILSIISEYNKLYKFDEIIPISAYSKEDIENVIEAVVKRLPYGPQYYPEDMITDSPEKIMVAEIVREKALDLLSEEIPHGIAVEVEKMKKRINKEIIDISVNIYCEKESHKPIIIGKGGKMLKEIGTRARNDIEKFLDMKVFLEVWVKVRKDWRDDENELRKLHFME